MKRLRGIALISLSLGAPLSAQNYLSTGDIGVAADGIFAVMSADGTTTREFSSNPRIARLVWDPKVPDSFVCGNAGSQTTRTGGAIYRKKFTSANTIETTTIIPLGRIGRPAEMYLDRNPDHLIVGTLASELHRVDIRDGTVEDIAVGATPWGRAAAFGFDLSTRSAFVLANTTNRELYRVDVATGAVTQVASGVGGGDLFVDPRRNRMLWMPSNRLYSVPLSDPGATPCEFFGFTGTPPTPSRNTLRAITFDPQGDFVIADYNRVYRIPNEPVCRFGGVAAEFVGRFGFPTRSMGTSVFGMSVVGSVDTSSRYGLRVESLPNGDAELELENAPTGFLLGFLLMSRDTSAAYGTGSLFGLMPDGLTIAILTQPIVPGNIFAHSGSLPPALSIPASVMQAFSTETWDCIGVGLDTQGAVIDTTNLVRITWR